MHFLTANMLSKQVLDRMVGAKRAYVREVQVKEVANSFT